MISVFWNDEEHFVAAPIYTAEPLVEEGASVLQPHGIPGLEGVELRALKVVSPDPEVGVLSWKGRDLGSELASPVGQVVLRHGEIRHFELAMKLSARSRSLKVEVDVPNRLTFDRRVGSDIVHEYLRESGFVCTSLRHAEAA